MFEGPFPPKDPDGIRRKFPDRVRRAKYYSISEIVEILKRRVPSSGTAVTSFCHQETEGKPGVTIYWTDWPPEESALRAEHCPHCYLQWGQRGHLKGCPNTGLDEW